MGKEMIIPIDLFVFYAAPYDPNRPWAKQNHKENLINWITYETNRRYDGKYSVYQYDWYYYDIKNRVKHYRTFLKCICDSEEEAKLCIDIYREMYLNHPEMIYEERWIYHDLY